MRNHAKHPRGHGRHSDVGCRRGVTVLSKRSASSVPPVQPADAGVHARAHAGLCEAELLVRDGDTAPGRTACSCLGHTRRCMAASLAAPPGDSPRPERDRTTRRSSSSGSSSPRPSHSRPGWRRKRALAARVRESAVVGAGRRQAGEPRIATEDSTNRSALALRLAVERAADEEPPQPDSYRRHRVGAGLETSLSRRCHCRVRAGGTSLSSSPPADCSVAPSGQLRAGRCHGARGYRRADVRGRSPRDRRRSLAARHPPTLPKTSADRVADECGGRARHVTVTVPFMPAASCPGTSQRMV